MIIYLRNTKSHISGELSPECLEELDAELSFNIPGGQFAVDGWEQRQRAKLTQGGIAKKKAMLRRNLTASEIAEITEYWRTCELSYKWDGKKHLFDKRNSTIPTGLLRRAYNIIKNHHEVKIVDKREIPPKRYNWKLHGIELFEDQEQGTKLCIKKQRGIAQAATGWGKTVVIGAVTARLGRKTLILSHRDTIAKQMRLRLEKMLKCPVGMIQGSRIEPSAVTVAMIQTICKPQFTKFLETIDVVIVDEAHHIASDQFMTVMNACRNAYFRFGFSATPFRENGDEMEIESGLAGFIFQISPSQLIKTGRLAKPFIYFLNNPPVTQFDRLSWQKQYKFCIIQNDFRNTMICRVVESFWKANKTVLVAVTQVQHGKILEKMLKTEYPKMKTRFIDGSNESEAKQTALKMLEKRQLDCVIATTVFGEGVDVPTLDAIVNAKGNASKIEVVQLIGRCLRVLASKSRAYYVDFVDNEHYTNKHSKTRINTLKKESEFKVRGFLGIAEFKAQFEKDLKEK